MAAARVDDIRRLRIDAGNSPVHDFRLRIDPGDDIVSEFQVVEILFFGVIPHADQIRLVADDVKFDLALVAGDETFQKRLVGLHIRQSLISGDSLIVAFLLVLRIDGPCGGRRDDVKRGDSRFVAGGKSVVVSLPRPDIAFRLDVVPARIDADAVDSENAVGLPAERAGTAGHSENKILAGGFFRREHFAERNPSREFSVLPIGEVVIGIPEAPAVEGPFRRQLHTAGGWYLHIDRLSRVRPGIHIKDLNCSGEPGIPVAAVLQLQGWGAVRRKQQIDVAVGFHRNGREFPFRHILQRLQIELPGGSLRIAFNIDADNLQRQFQRFALILVPGGNGKLEFPGECLIAAGRQRFSVTLHQLLFGVTKPQDHLLDAVSLEEISLQGELKSIAIGEGDRLAEPYFGAFATGGPTDGERRLFRSGNGFVRKSAFGSACSGEKGGPRVSGGKPDHRLRHRNEAAE
ncbi:hypothetical protein SDC9_111892 [bioreactor metagenome]|uniref:Uncharacterized protein n=1 Tax=bioreactor metagenome TaxID=1076179 RepID=A0A645BHQ3_9ZZZZ